MQLHPEARALPFSHQGPFVTTTDGGMLCFDERHAHVSHDEGISWVSFPLFADESRFKASEERALLRTRKGTVIAAWMNLAEKRHPAGFKWGGPPEEFAQWILPTCVSRSHDDGRTWAAPILLNRPWCGCVHSMIQMRSGRVVLVAQEVIPEWRHATVVFVSDDEGQSWGRSHVLDIGEGRHDHAGSCEATVIERRDGSLWMLLRNESGFLYEATSCDGGLTWVDFQRTSIPSVTCCPQLGTLADGSAVLLWNPPPRYDPTERAARDELALAFSDDDGATWGRTHIIAADYPRVRPANHWWRVSYPYLYERRPGELWITTMQGGLRMRINRDAIDRGSIPLPPVVVLFGDSTTARRPAEVKRVYAVHLQERLLQAGFNHAISNRGIPANTTDDARARLEADVLALHPSVVVMQFGLNDAAVDVWKDPPATGPRVARERYIANLRDMIGQLKAHGIAVVLMTPNRMYWSPILLELCGKPPYDPANPESFNALFLDGYVAAVRELAAKEDVPLVDINQAYRDAADPRGLLLARCQQHPSDAGHRLVADLLAPVVIKLLQARAGLP